MSTLTLSSSRAYTDTSNVSPQDVLLRARPYARYAGCFMLLPLLPKRPPLPPLPQEVWRRVIMMIIVDEEVQTLQKDKGKRLAKNEKKWSRWSLALVCKEMKEYALPLLYAHCEISTMSILKKFTALMHDSDQKWDSLRRIPYSTPGRWVQSLKLSELEISSQADGYTVDALFSTLFPLLPFLMHLELSLSLQLSRRAFMSLAMRDGAQNLRVLTGIRYDASTIISGEDPLTELVSCCGGLEELEIVGTGPDNINTLIDAEATSTLSALNSSPPRPPAAPLHLPHLHTLTLLATPKSPLLLRLTHSTLPSLQSVTITPYGDLLPTHTLVTDFLATHGATITQLVLHTPKSWPTVRFPPPASLLSLLPNLTALSLETLSFGFNIPETASESRPCAVTRCTEKGRDDCGHPLSVVWISRPQPSARAELLRAVARLPHLREVRARDVRWAHRGMSARALEAGFQGEMYAWRRLLAPYGVKMLDSDGLESAPF